MRLSVVVAGLVLVCGCMYTAQADVNADAWARYWSAWKQQLGDAAKYATFMQPPMVMDKNPEWQLNRLCLTVPKWQGTFEQFSDVYNAYGEMIDSFQTNVDDAQKKQIADLKDILDTKQKLQTDCFARSYPEYERAYANMPPDARPTWLEWKKLSKACDAETSAVSVAQTRYDRILDSSLRGFQYVADSQKAWSNTEFQTVLLKGDGTKTPTPVPICDVSPSWTQTLNSWQSGQRNPGQVDMSSSTETKSEWEWSAGGSLGVKVGWFSIGGDGGGGQKSIDTSASNFKMTLKWEALQSFQFNQGGWYMPAVAAGHPKGPFKPGTAIGSGKTKLWGDGGMLSLVPTNLVVVYNPSVTMTIDKTTYNEVQKTWKAGGGVCVFGLCIGGHGGGSSKTSEFHDDTSTFTLGDDSNQPKIVAITNNAMGLEPSNLNLMGGVARATRRVAGAGAGSGSSTFCVDAKDLSTTRGTLNVAVGTSDVTISGADASFTGSLTVSSKC